jgi:hypothetical protein
MTSLTGCAIRLPTFFLINRSCGPKLRRGMQRDFQTAFRFLLSSDVRAFPNCGETLKTSGRDAVSFTLNTFSFFVKVIEGVGRGKRQADQFVLVLCRS